MVPSVCLDGGVDKAILKRSYRVVMFEVERALIDRFAIAVVVWTRAFQQCLRGTYC